jgi:hypothetical protein
MKICKALVFMVAAMITLPAFGGLMEFQIGTEGTDGGVNNWPGGEAPEFAIDGLGQKYLNFGETYTGIAVTPASGPSVALSITVWAANDSPERDPADFVVYGLNVPVSGDPGNVISGLTLIASDTIALPENRNEGGSTPLYAANSATVFFTNDVPYESYVIAFPAVKDVSANSMQAAEIQLNLVSGAPIFVAGDVIRGGQMIPEPSTCLLALFGTVLLGCRFRR